jgi:hypothetical protein
MALARQGGLPVLPITTRPLAEVIVRGGPLGLVLQRTPVSSPPMAALWDNISAHQGSELRIYSVTSLDGQNRPNMTGSLQRPSH